MAEGATKLLTFNLGTNGGEHTFATHEDAAAFAKNEFDYWSFLSKIPRNGETDPHRPSIDAFVQMLNTGSQRSAQWGRGEIPKEQVAEHFVGAYVRNQPRLIASNTPTAAFLKSSFERGEFERVGVLLSYLSNGSYNVNGSNHRHMRHIVAFHVFDSGGSSESSAAAMRNLLDVQSTHNELVEQARSELNSITATHDDHVAMFDDFVAKETAKVESWRAEHTKTTEERVVEALASMRRTEATYKEAMELEAPVAYWSEKADGHDKRIWKFALAAGLFAVAVGGGLLGGLWWMFEHAITLAKDNPTVPLAAYVILGTMGLAATTIVFWCGRVLVRLFLSELHLAMDARERVTMAKSYLALTSNAAVSKEERSIVLQALFRPTQDGIVKDDGSQDATVAAALARIVGR